MSPLRVHTHTNIKSCATIHLSIHRIEADTSMCAYTHQHQTLFLFVQLYILSFNRIESDNSCHFFVCCHLTELRPTNSCHLHNQVNRMQQYLQASDPTPVIVLILSGNSCAFTASFAKARKILVSLIYDRVELGRHTCYIYI